MESQLECSICLENITCTTTNYTATSCGHTFHSKCLVTYIINYKKEKCPYCRQDLCDTPKPTVPKRRQRTSTIATVVTPTVPSMSIDEDDIIEVRVCIVNNINYLVDDNFNIYDFNSHTEIGKLCTLTQSIILN